MSNKNKNIENVNETADNTATTTDETVDTSKETNNSESDNEDNESNDDTKDSSKKSKHPILSELFSYACVIGCALLTAYVIVHFILSNNVIPSASMSPTISVGTRLFGFRLAYNFSEPERGDIIVFEYPVDESQYYIKRIIGMPGETIEVKDGSVYIDGEELDESDYLDCTIEGEFGPYVIPEDNYFVMGDNRNNSSDSRYWNAKAEEAGLSTKENDYTCVPFDNIVSKAIIQYYPKIKLIE